MLRTLAAVALVPCMAVVAGEEIEEVVVIGTYLEDETFRAETQVSVDRSELESIRPAEPEQLLQRLPGLSIFRPGGPGGVSEVFLRGAEANFTAVFIDGVRLNNPANTRGGSFDFSTLGVSEIGRIDIAMGAMSAIYGSDAMAGVVRIESAWPETGGRMAFVEAGSEADWRVGAAASFGVSASTSLGIRASTQDRGDEIDGSSLERSNFSTSLAGRRGNGDRWRIDLRHVERDRSSFPEVSGGPELAVLRDLEIAEGETTSFSAMTDWTVTPAWEAEIIASWAELEDDMVTPAVPPGELDPQPAFSSLSDYRRGQLLWINRVAAGGRSRLAFGLDLIDEQGRDDGVVDLGFALVSNGYRLDRTVVSGFLELGSEWAADLSSTLALRFDHSDEESRASGKLGFAKEFDAGGARLWARLASGFKLPSFFALANPLVGNPNLVSEKVTSLEAGYDWEIGSSVVAEISLFASEYEDLVDFDFESFTNINRGEIDIEGVFARVQAQLSPTLWFGADATLSDVSSASGPLRRRPEHTGGINLTWRPSAAWSVDAVARYVGERLITSIPTGDVIDGAYIVADAVARYRHSEKLALWLAVDNLFDTDYQHAPGFPAPGLRARVGAEVRF